MVMTLLVSHVLTSWLKMVAPWNIDAAETLVVADPSFQPDIATLRFVSFRNIFAKVVTRVVFQIFPDPE